MGGFLMEHVPNRCGWGGGVERQQKIQSDGTPEQPMANQKKKAKIAAADRSVDQVADYRFPEATRKNNPPAKIAAEGYVPLIPKAEYLYSPRRPPELRFDPTGRTDELPDLLAKATKQKLTEAEACALAQALRDHEPWLEWAGKRETKSFAIEPVALHIH